MSERNYPGDEAAYESDDASERTTDRVAAVVAAYLDFLEGLAGRPALDELADDDRRRAVAMINSLLAGRGIELNGSTPPLETLLAGTELEPLLESPDPGSDLALDGGWDREAASARPAGRIDRERARVERIEFALRGADSHVVVRAEPHKLLGPAVTVAYLDLLVVFVPIDGPGPVITDDTEAVLSRVLSDDTDLDYVGVVASESNDLLTQLLSASDLGQATAVPSDDLQVPWPPVLPLPLALRAVLELAAPSWEPFDFDTGKREPLQLARIAADAAHRILARETTRPYRGQKGQAYKSFAGSEATFTSLIVTLAGPGATDAAVAAALDRIVQDAA
jgi:hypothetical protein